MNDEERMSSPPASPGANDLDDDDEKAIVQFDKEEEKVALKVSIELQMLSYNESTVKWINFRLDKFSRFSRILAIFAKFCLRKIFKIAIFAETPRKMKEIR